MTDVVCANANCSNKVGETLKGRTKCGTCEAPKYFGNFTTAPLMILRFIMTGFICIFAATKELRSLLRAAEIILVFLEQTGACIKATANDLNSWKPTSNDFCTIVCKIGKHLSTTAAFDPTDVGAYFMMIQTITVDAALAAAAITTEDADNFKANNHSTTAYYTKIYAVQHSPASRLFWEQTKTHKSMEAGLEKVTLTLKSDERTFASNRKLQEIFARLAQEHAAAAAAARAAAMAATTAEAMQLDETAVAAEPVVTTAA